MTFAENYIETEEFEAKVEAQGSPPGLVDRILALREAKNKLFAGGRIVLTVVVREKAVTWTGAIESTRSAAIDPASTKFWCIGVASDGLGGNCTETNAECEELQHKFETLKSEVGSCEGAKSAWCFPVESEHRKLCWDTAARCEEHQADVVKRATGVGPCADMF